MFAESRAWASCSSTVTLVVADANVAGADSLPAATPCVGAAASEPAPMNPAIGAAVARTMARQAKARVIRRSICSPPSVPLRRRRAVHH